LKNQMKEFDFLGFNNTTTCENSYRWRIRTIECSRKTFGWI